MPQEVNLKIVVYMRVLTILNMRKTHKTTGFYINRIYAVNKN